MTIYSDFKPTFLIIKHHTITNKFYLHKTVRKDPVSYLGSGTYWVNHIKKYGTQYVETVWFCLFLDKETLVTTATMLSLMYNIVKSPEWLNQMNENGLGGGVIGQCKNMVTVRDKNGKCFKVQKNDPRLITKEVEPNITGFKHSQETKEKMKISRVKYQNSKMVKIIHVFNNNQVLQFEFIGTWSKEAKNYGLPARLFENSFNNGGKPLEPKHKESKQFTGWYAKVMS